MRIENNTAGEHNKQNSSYKDFKKKQAIINKRQNALMFLSIFAVLLLIFLGVAKLMSPDIDISLGDDNTKIEDEDFHREIDSRLKALQEEDDVNSSSNADETEEDGIVKIPKFGEKEFKPTDENEPVPTSTTQTTHSNDAETTGNNTNPISPDTAPTSLKNNAISNVGGTAPAANVSKTYRVYVGMYSTQSQAEVARGILQEAGLGVTPHIKQAAGGYTLQVGAFSSKDSASNLANKLLINNYPARIVTD